MVEKHFTVIDKTGIHARPASILVKTANQFQSEITLVYNDKDVNVKSILGIMSLGIGHGESFAVRVTGDDAAEALARLGETLQDEGMAE
jgi:phosphocarrier protein